jgi:hypothetical protein
VKQPKIILFDIETAPIQAHVWQLYDTNVINIIKDWELLSFSYKELGSNTTHCFSRRTVKSEKKLVKKLHEVMAGADILVAHNGNKFDIKKANAKFIQFELEPPTPSFSVDTRAVAKAHFKFSSNKLDDLGHLLGVGRKMKTGGFDLWEDCMAGKRAAWLKMEKYNVQDVLLLERVYLKLRPWIANHPNIGQLVGKPESCPKCGSERPMRFRGYRHTPSGRAKRFQCRDCGGWVRQKTVETVSKPKFVNLK